MTKIAFEKLLNKIYGVCTDRVGVRNQLGATREYGTWLRSADREQFNNLYNHYLGTGKIWGDESQEIPT